MSSLDGAQSQAERTALAWSRTLLASAGLLAFVAVAGARTHVPAILVGLLGAASVVVLAASWVAPRRLWSTATTALRGDVPAAGPVRTLLLAGSVTLLSGISLVITMAGGRT